MDDRKRICCFCEKWGSGGIESFLINVLENMDRSGLAFEIVTTQLESELYLPRLERCGVPLTLLSGRTRRLAENHAAFRRLLRDRCYDVVHLNIYHALSLLYARDAMRAGVPVRIAHSHNNGLRRSLLRPVKLLIHRWARAALTRYATERVACSRMAAEFMFSSAADVRIVPNGIALDRFAFSEEDRDRVRRERGWEDRFVLGSVGRLCQQKNQAFLLEVVGALARLRPEALLLLVGEGEDRAMLVRRAGELGVSDRVVFYGTSDDMPPLMSAMDAFSLPSWFEGLGIAAIEAQASGLPVLCSENVPPEAIVTPQARRMPLAAGPQAWAEKLAKVDAAGRNAAADRLREAGYDVADAASQLRTLYGKGLVR